MTNAPRRLPVGNRLLTGVADLGFTKDIYFQRRLIGQFHAESERIGPRVVVYFLCFSPKSTLKIGSTLQVNEATRLQPARVEVEAAYQFHG